MKLSVSLPEEDVARIDEYVRATGLKSRSAAVQHAVRLLGAVELEEAYAAAWDEWVATGDAEAWESAAGDGLVDAAR